MVLVVSVEFSGEDVRRTLLTIYSEADGESVRIVQEGKVITLGHAGLGAHVVMPLFARKRRSMELGNTSCWDRTATHSRRQ
jgi:hypothetical protein